MEPAAWPKLSLPGWRENACDWLSWRTSNCELAQPERRWEGENLSRCRATPRWATRYHENTWAAINFLRNFFLGDELGATPLRWSDGASPIEAPTRGEVLRSGIAHAAPAPNLS